MYGTGFGTEGIFCTNVHHRPLSEVVMVPYTPFYLIARSYLLLSKGAIFEQLLYLTLKDYHNYGK